jgi:hypothetical protein
MRPVTVQLVTENGNNSLGDVANPVVCDIISGGGALADQPVYFDDDPFETGDSPATIDINGSTLGRNATEGYVINDGAGNIKVELSPDGTFTQAAENQIILKKNEILKWGDISVDSIEITWVADSAYRVSAI